MLPLGSSLLMWVWWVIFLKIRTGGTHAAEGYGVSMEHRPVALGRR